MNETDELTSSVRAPTDMERFALLDPFESLQLQTRGDQPGYILITRVPSGYLIARHQFGKYDTPVFVSRVPWN